MKKFLLIAIVAVALLSAGVFFSKNSSIPSNHVSPSIIPNNPTASNPGSYCSHKDIQATLSFDHAAGNVYGTFMLKNISARTCQIKGNNLIAVNIQPSGINNISTKQMGKPETDIFTLSPNQIIYSQIHYPNGPQCSTGIQDTKGTFTYALSPTEIVSFVDQNGSKEQHLIACKQNSEMTVIDIWNMSSKPIN